MSGVLARSCQLEPAALSASSARQFLREVLLEAGRSQWLDAAELAMSEVVTNAVLHAHTRVELTVQVDDDQVRVEVRDFSPVLPSQRSYTEEATTGRGMALVEAVTLSCGVQSLGPGGKVVWFSVGELLESASEDDLLAQWADGDADVPPTPAVTEPAPAGVTLAGLPPTLWLAAREHHDAALRELALYRASHPDDPSSLADLAAADDARFLITNALEAALARARDHGEAVRPLPPAHPGALPAVPQTLDLGLTVRADQAASFAALQDALDETERLAVAELLLVRPALPEIMAVRDWACEQVIAQLSGAPPTPWSGADDDRFTTEVHSVPGRGLAWDDSRVRDADQLVVAADDANRIVSVSRPLADALGWRVEDLVGRRVVALVPHRFREAHVSGFSRHLSTGQARVLGVPIDLPVLRSDGSEVLCRFLIESVPSENGRNVYLAWLSAPD